MDLNQKEIDALRRLGEEYLSAATLPVQKEKVTLWKALNHGKMRRPMVVIDQLPMNELNGNGELTCTVQSDLYWQGVEFGLRQSLYCWNHFPVDMVLNPFIEIPLVIENTGYGVFVQEDVLFSDESSNIVSHRFENQFQTMEDIKKIKDMRIIHHSAESARRFEEAKEIFGSLPLRQSGISSFHLGPWDTLSTLMGIDNIYFALIDQPELLHAAMTRMTDSILGALRDINEQGIYNTGATVCHCSYLFDDNLLPAPGLGKEPYTKNGWGFGLAQLFTSVSPDVTKEFEIPYITKMAKEFGGIYYGCCDRLDDRLDLIKTIPNLRKVSCSPWSDKRNFAENIGDKLVMSYKPNPAFLAAETVDESAIEKDLRETVELARSLNVNLEMILKDLSTVQYRPERITRFHEIAMKIVETY